MDKNYLLHITNELYRLTLLFPKKEPLRYKIRGVANDILAGMMSSMVSEQNLQPIELKTLEKIRGNLEVIDGFFEVVKSQQWVKHAEILNLQEEYGKVKGYLLRQNGLLEEIKEVDEKTEPLPLEIPAQKENGVTIPERQQKIIKVLEEKGRAQVWEIKKVFPDVTKRTLRRDFENLLKEGVVERIGEKNNTFYRLKVRTG
jgi:hypothetical protein